MIGMVSVSVQLSSQNSLNVLYIDALCCGSLYAVGVKPVDVGITRLLPSREARQLKALKTVDAA